MITQHVYPIKGHLRLVYSFLQNFQGNIMDPSKKIQHGQTVPDTKFQVSGTCLGFRFGVVNFFCPIPFQYKIIIIKYRSAMFGLSKYPLHRNLHPELYVQWERKYFKLRSHQKTHLSPKFCLM